MIVNGACKFCKQVAITNAETEEEAIYQATMACDCISAMRYRERQTKAIEAMAQMEEMYHAENAPETVISLTNANIKEMVEGNLAKAQYILPNGKKLTVAAKGQKFTVETSQAKKKKVEV